MRTHSMSVTALVLAALVMASGCEEKPTAGTNAPTAAPTPTANADGHDHGAAGDHAHEGGEEGMAGHSGTVIGLGEQTIGAFAATASRDGTPIVAGKDSPIDVTVTAAPGSGAKAAAVRFWIGTQDAKGSVKAKGEIEDPKEPGRWHAHAEIPNPLPAESRLWVEIEDDRGGRTVGGFDLKNDG